MKNKNYYAVLNVNDRCMDFDCRCNRVKFMDGFVFFQEHTNENDVTLAIIPKENILFYRNGVGSYMEAVRECNNSLRKENRNTEVAE